MKANLLLHICFIILLLSSCKKETPDKEITDPEALSEEDVKILDNKKEIHNIELNSIILPNDMDVYSFLAEVDPDFLNKWTTQPLDWSLDKQLRPTNSPYDNLGPQDSRNLLNTRLTTMAWVLVNRNNFQYPSEGQNAPSQNGLAYSWGGKDHTKRKFPEKLTSCTDRLYSLDCSGFIYQLFKYAGVSIVNGTADEQRKPEVLQKSIKSSIPQMRKIKVENLGSLPIENINNGDIIYWPLPDGRAEHIGMILKKKDGGLGVFQSNGSPGYSVSECIKNQGLGRGPRILELGDAHWFGPEKKYEIVRINSELSGKWRLFLKCQSGFYDAIIMDLNFKTSSSNTFEVEGEGIDYDGDILICSGKLNYNKDTNEIGGTLLINSPDHLDYYRYDSFVVKLSRDETQYFPLTLGQNKEPGCLLEGKLLNLEQEERNIRKNNKKTKIPLHKGIL